MTKRVTDAILKEAENCGAKDFDINNPEHLYEILSEADAVYEYPRSDLSWYSVYSRVVKIGEIYVRYQDAVASGDRHPTELGWSFDPNTIVEVEPHSVVVTKYRVKKDT